MDTVLLEIGQISITIGQFLGALVASAFLFILYRFLITGPLAQAMRKSLLSPKESRKIRLNVLIIFLTLGILILVYMLGLDFVLYNNERINIHVSTIVGGVLILEFARFLDWLISKVVINRVYASREQVRTTRERDESGESIGSKTVQYLVYILAILLFLNSFQIDKTLFTFEDKDYVFNFKISTIFRTVLIFFIARLLVWFLTQIVLHGYYKRQKIELGARFAINQLLKYVIYTVSFIIALETLGIQMTLLWGGAAALLVGVGLGLQQTFNDFISGVILLFERSVEVGDVLEISGVIGTVKKIGMRSSLIEARGHRTIIVPNSKLVIDNVINWSHYHKMARFEVAIGVAYGSDTQLVKQLLLETVQNDRHVLDYPSPFVRLEDFADSSLLFKVYFFSKEFINIEDVKSDIRLEIDRLFRENEIKIPFPQREVWPGGEA